MKFTVQRRLAAELLDCSPKKVRFETEAAEEIKEAITKADLRGLIASGIVYKQRTNGPSKSRVRKNQAQKTKGRQRGKGSRKGKASARETPKKTWMNKVRSQRGLIKRMKENGLLETKTYRELYLKVKGGFFRNQRHIKLYVDEHSLLTKK